MANHILGIVGPSGTGKSSSIIPNEELGIKGLDPTKTFYINVYSKPLPGKGWKKLYNKENKNYVESANPTEIVKYIQYVNEKMPHITTIVVDDYQYTMANEFFMRANEKTYDKFTDIGNGAFKILTSYKSLRDNLMLVILTHSDDDNQIKTIGKLVNEKLTPAGLMTVVLYSDVTVKGKKVEYNFVTNNNGIYPAKSPHGMFKDLYIPNDLGAVIETIQSYDNGD